jgi:hypothetical protein
MDQNEFKQKLSEVALWRIPDIVKETTETKLRGKKTNEEQYQLEHEEQFIDIFEGKNPTAPPELVGLKEEKTLCADCGNQCSKAQRREIKYFRNLPGHINHTRTRCIECNMYWHPETGKFDLRPGPATSVYLMWAKRQFTANKKLNKTQGDK